MPRTYQVISGDGHVETPLDAWKKYIPLKWQDRAPRMVKIPEGGEAWIMEGQPIMYQGQNISAGRPVKYKYETMWNPDGTHVAGTGDAVQRLRDQDLDGIDAEVLYPPVWGPRFFEGIAEREGYLVMIQAYNTYLAQEFCSVAPDRLIGTCVMPVTGLDDTLRELERCKELGYKAVMLQRFPNGSRESTKEDDRFWERALELGMLLAPHGGFAGPVPPPATGGGTSFQSFAMSLCSNHASVSCMYTMAQMIASGVLDRFPEMRMYLAETHASWIPSALWNADSNYELFGGWFGSPLKMKPSEYIKRHFLFSFVRDNIAMEMLDHLPVDNLMWGSDVPHSITTFPKSREYIAEAFRNVPASVKRKILLENPARFFGLDLEKPLTPTPK